MKEFTPFPKMARLSRDIIITEKIDGTNAQVCISDPLEDTDGSEGFTSATDKDGKVWNIHAGSRTRWITPTQDNYGFAAWVWEHANELVNLGPGRHFGEWWGQGIQRKYGMKEKRFSLFNTQRWCLHNEEPQEIPTLDPRVTKMEQVLPECCHLVPVLYKGPFDTEAIDAELRLLSHGSIAAPGFKNPEGIVVFHTAGNVGFKKTIEKDEVPKSKH